MSVARPRSRSARHPQSRTIVRPTAALAALLVAAALASAQPAGADIGEAIILRCTHNKPLSGFSQSAYSKALKELSADTEEYGSCSSRIHQAQLAAAAAGRGGGGASGPSATAPTPIAATPSEQRAIARAQHAGSEPIELGGGQVVHPGVVHVEVASALSSLPTPVLATIAFLLAGLLVAAGGVLRNRLRGRSN